MRFMVFMVPDQKKYEAGVMPSPELINRMMKYNEELSKAGILLGLDGLHPTSKGARIRFKGGKGTVTDGPFTEGKELIGGYWIWQVKSKAEAVEWAQRCPAENGDLLEIRQIFDPADFGPEVAAREGELAAEIAKKAEKNKKRPSP